MKKVNSNLFKFLAIFFVLSAVITLFFFKFWPVLSHNTIYYCRSFLSGSLINVPPVFHTVVFIAIVFLISAVLIKVFFVLIQGYKFKRNLDFSINSSKKLSPILEELKLKEKVVVVKDNKPFAFCFGIKNSQIYISTKTIKIMNADELRAILFHEKYHLQKKDGMIMLVASLTKLAFPFFPLIADFIEQYKLEREIKADKEAVSIVGRENLISVLAKLLSFPRIPLLTASSIADINTVEARIKAISLKQNVKIKYKKTNVFISFFSFALFLLFLVIPVQATELHVNNQNTMMVCISDDECAVRCRENTHLINKKIDSVYKKDASYPFTPAK